MRKFKALVIDDEHLARKAIISLIREYPELEVAGEADGAKQAARLIDMLQPDLLFLDIQMPGMDGFDVLRALDAERMPAIVFVTAFDDYAIQAFEAHALDYLLKPIDEDRLADALARTRDFVERNQALRHRESLLRLPPHRLPVDPLGLEDRPQLRRLLDHLDQVVEELLLE